MVRKSKYATLRTRVPAEVAEAVNAMATADYPSYRVLRDIVVAHVSGTSRSAVSLETLIQLRATAEAVGYASVDALLQDLAAAFLRVYRYSRGLLAEDESTPDEDIRDMFGEMIYEVEKGRAIRKTTK